MGSEVKAPVEDRSGGQIARVSTEENLPLSARLRHAPAEKRRTRSLERGAEVGRRTSGRSQTSAKNEKMPQDGKRPTNPHKSPYRSIDSAGKARNS